MRDGKEIRLDKSNEGMKKTKTNQVNDSGLDGLFNGKFAARTERNRSHYR